MVKLFMVPRLAAGIRSGRAWASAPSTTSTIRCEVSTLPPATAWGGSASRMLPLGTTTRTGANAPLLAGMSAPVTQRATYQVADSVMARTAFSGPATAGLDPAQSTVISPSPTVTRTLSLGPSRCGPSPCSAAWGLGLPSSSISSTKV